MVQRNYLVNYGHGGFIGRFRASDPHSRDDRVIIRSLRGEEIGRVLSEASAIGVGPPVEGDILRIAGDEDANEIDRLSGLAAKLVADAQDLAAKLGLPLVVLDGEMMLNPREGILQAVHWDECDATPLFEELTRRFGFLVRLADLTATPVPPAKGCETCGAEKSGCSSCGTGGGCSTGSCSSGSVKSAEELTTYFAGLRKQMDATAERVSLH